MTINKRKTMNWQELVGKVGGLMGFIGMFASRVVGYFSELQFASLVANRLYTWKEPKNWIQERDTILQEKGHRWRRDP